MKSLPDNFTIHYPGMTMAFPYNQIVINAQTVAAVPPPYSHTYKIVVDENPAFLVLSFQLSYTQRDELSEEEILDEGFSQDDNFSWSGKLNKIWKQQLDELLKNTHFNPAPPSGGDYTVEVLPTPGDTAAAPRFVADRESRKWIYFVQELRQAILESEQIEAPLTLEYLRITQGVATNVVLNGSFADRTFSVRVDNRPVEQFDWSVLQKTVNLVFNETEIDPEMSMTKRPTRDGHYLMIPGAGWLELSVGLVSRYEDDPIIEKIKSAMHGFIGG